MASIVSSLSQSQWSRDLDLVELRDLTPPEAMDETSADSTHFLSWGAGLIQHFEEMPLPESMSNEEPPASVSFGHTDSTIHPALRESDPAIRRNLSEQSRQVFTARKDALEITTAQYDEASSRRSKLLDSKDKLQRKQCWNPWPLRRRVIIIFILFCVTLIVALETILSRSRSQNGLADGNYKSHYYWTYGPTAVLTLLVAAWHRVDYRMKQMQPWKQLAEKPAHASYNLLNDYVSPSLPEVLLSSVKRKHFGVTMSVLVGLIFQLLIIFSTALFALQSFDVTDTTHSISLLDRFNATSLVYPGELPLLVTAAISRLNISYPAWTNDKFALQSFEATQLSESETNLTAVVQGFGIELGKCETGTVRWPNASTLRTSHPNATFTTPSYRCDSAFPFSLVDTHYYSAALIISSCLNTRNETLDLTMVYIGIATGYSYAWSPFTFLICRPESTLFESSVTIAGNLQSSGAGLNFSMSPPSSVSHPDWDFPTSISTSLRKRSLVQFPSLKSVTSFDTFFYLLAWKNPTVPITAYLDPSFLEEKAGEVYSQYGAQLAKRMLFVNQTTTGLGHLQGKRDRLVVKIVSLRLMEAFTTLAIVCLLIFIWFRPSRVVPADPSSVASFTTILAGSPDLTELLNGTGSWTMKSVGTRLASSTWESSKPHHTFKIQKLSPLEHLDGDSTDPDAGTQHNLSDEAIRPISWWRPFAVKPVGTAACVILPCLVILALQISLWYSQKHNGMANVNTSGAGHYGWTFIPTLVMVAISLSFQSLDYTIRIIQPFAVLRNGAASSSASLWSHPLRSSAPLAFVQAVHLRQWPLLSAMLPAFLAPFLTIIASGLYSPQNVVYPTPASVALTGWFNPLSNSSGFISPSYGIDLVSIPSTLAQESGTNYPANTFKDLAFPSLSLLSQSEAAIGSKPTVDITLPALRNTLSCRPTTIESQRVDGLYHAVLNVNVSTGCGAPLEVYDFQSTTDGYFGRVVSSSTWNWTTGCPWQMVVFGQNSSESVVTTTAIVCNSPVVEKLDVVMSLNVPDLSVDFSNPPTPDEATTKHFSNAVFDITTVFLDNGPELAGDGFSWDYRFIYALINGVDSLPKQEYLNSTNLARGVEQLYALLGAQSLNVLNRIPIGNTSVAQVVNGTFANVYRIRLQQNVLSTRLLQGLLAAMVLCSGACFLIIDTKRLLPKNPCSIAGLASLLAGAEMLSRDVVPEGSEMLGERELKARGVFDGYLFSMGWHDNRHGGVARWGIDIGMKDE